MASTAASAFKTAKITGLISSAHLMSHVYYLALPPLFPLLKAEFGVSYTALGLLVAVFNIGTGIGQTPIGFVVDRLGARNVLVVGMILQASAIGLIALSGSYLALLGLFALAGLAHSVYHPADYSILSSVVEPSRLGRAFSVHAFSDNLGGTLTPLLMVGLVALWDWRMAFAILGGVGLLIAVVVMTQGPLLTGEGRESPVLKKKVRVEFKERLLLLFSVPVLLCFLYNMIMVMGVTGIRTFSVSALVAIYDTPLAIANGALAGYMAGTAIGMLAGGFIADRLGPRVITAVVALVLTAALFFSLGGIAMPIFLLAATMSMAGFFRGIIQATRDLLILSVTPEGSAGKVFAFVSTGANVGSTIMPLVLGVVMDQGDPRMVFWIAGSFVLLALFTFIGIKRIAP